jgi:DNA-binding SARP family transcriptional activator
MNDACRDVDGMQQACHDIRPSTLGAAGGSEGHDPVLCAIPLLRMNLLGGFRVERTDIGCTVTGWKRQSAKTLTKLLAVQPGHALHREQITDVLWPGVDEESALNSFGKALHAARHALEPELPRRKDSAYLRLADGRLILNTEHVVVDADWFEQLAEDAMRHGDIEAYEAALAAYGGELLPEDRYEGWCSERRSILVESHIRLLLGMAEALEGRGAYNDAADRLRDVIGQDPTREAVHRRLMRLYARMGTPDQAVRQFRLCEDVLRRELDLAPQPETVSLYDEIVTGRLLLQPSHPGPDGDRSNLRRPSVHTVNGRPFIGRERVLERMINHLACRDEAQPGMIIVSGEAGVGKTRLLEEFATRAREQGTVTLCGGRGAHASQFACGPFAVALEDYAARRSQAERTELSRLYPALKRFVPSLGPSTPLPVSASELRDYHLDIIPTVVQFLTDLAQTQPVLLVLGDLHEIDAVGLDLIRYLAHLAVHAPLLMVGALRDSDIEATPGLRRMIEAMTRERLWLRIELHCLSRRATDQLVQAMPPGVHVSEDTLAEIHAQSRGNPLLVREIVDSLSSCDLGGRQDRSWFTLPAQTRTRFLTAMRLVLMDEPLRRVLGLAATVDTAEISLNQLRAGAAVLDPPVPVHVLFEALDRALRMRILEEQDEGYTFRHPVVRAALYDCLPRHRRDEFRAALAAPPMQSRRSTDRLAGRTWRVRPLNPPWRDRWHHSPLPCSRDDGGPVGRPAGLHGVNLDRQVEVRWNARPMLIGVASASLS